MRFVGGRSGAAAVKETAPKRKKKKNKCVKGDDRLLAKNPKGRPRLNLQLKKGIFILPSSEQTKDTRMAWPDVSKGCSLVKRKKIGRRKTVNSPTEIRSKAKGGDLTGAVAEVGVEK